MGRHQGGTHDGCMRRWRAIRISPSEHARRALPGPLGELAARELQAAADFGHRLGQDTLIAKLAGDVLARHATR